MSSRLRSALTRLSIGSQPASSQGAAAHRNANVTDAEEDAEASTEVNTDSSGAPSFRPPSYAALEQPLYRGTASNLLVIASAARKKSRPKAKLKPLVLCPGSNTSVDATLLDEPAQANGETAVELVDDEILLTDTCFDEGYSNEGGLGWRGERTRREGEERTLFSEDNYDEEDERTLFSEPNIREVEEQTLFSSPNYGHEEEDEFMDSAVWLAPEYEHEHEDAELLETAWTCKTDAGIGVEVGLFSDMDMDRDMEMEMEMETGGEMDLYMDGDIGMMQNDTLFSDLDMNMYEDGEIGMVQDITLFSDLDTETEQDEHLLLDGEDGSDDGSDDGSEGEAEVEIVEMLMSNQ